MDDKEMFDCTHLKNQICFPLYVSAKEIVRLHRKPLAELNLTYTQYVVMMALWEYGGMTESELGKRVYLDSGTLTPLLKRLEKRCLIQRVRPSDNGRVLRLTLTADGETLKEKAQNVPSVVRDQINLSEEELAQLRILLNKVLVGLEEV